MFSRGHVKSRRRKLFVSRFDPGDHFYLRFFDGVMPGGDRATDTKYNTIADARAAADEMGYDLARDLMVVSRNGNTESNR
jgi:hypothetical protein